MTILVSGVRFDHIALVYSRQSFMHLYIMVQKKKLVDLTLDQLCDQFRKSNESVSGTKDELMIRQQDLLVLQGEGMNAEEFEFKAEEALDGDEKSDIISTQSPSKSTLGLDLTKMLEMLTGTMKKN